MTNHPRTLAAGDRKAPRANQSLSTSTNLDLFNRNRFELVVKMTDFAIAAITRH
jgi:hypothetical protein